MDKKYEVEIKKEMATLDMMWRAGGTNEAIQRMREHEEYLKLHGSSVEVTAYKRWMSGDEISRELK